MASWVLSPVLSGFIAVFLFLFVRTFVLRSEDAAKRAVLIFPFLVTATVAVNGGSWGVHHTMVEGLSG